MLRRSACNQHTRCRFGLPGFTTVQNAVLWFSQFLQRPQATLKGLFDQRASQSRISLQTSHVHSSYTHMTTLSPFLYRVTPGPTSSTIPWEWRVRRRVRPASSAKCQQAQKHLKGIHH